MIDCDTGGPTGGTSTNRTPISNVGGGRRANHILDTYFIGSAGDPELLEIWGYTDRFSYEPGDTVSLRVSTTASTWDLEIARDGIEIEEVLCVRDLVGLAHDTPRDCSVVGCGWPVAREFVIGDDWQPGMYLVTMRGHRGEATVEEHHMFIVRSSPRSSPAPMLLLCATGTWVAYNCWGGSNAYEGIAGPTGDQFSPVLSTQRPWTRGFCKLPEGAPRALPDTRSEPGDMARYPYMEWAYAHGYSKKYASAGWATYERHFAHWTERSGYELDYATLHDLEDHPGLLDGYRCVVIVGHDEYWSRKMRDSIDSWVDRGGRLARFAGNFVWQIRLEDDGQTQVCYKHSAADDDPVRDTADSRLLTGAWEDPEIGWPGAHTMGVNGLRGIYTGFGNCVGRGSGGFTVYRHEHWSLEGTNTGYGDVLGAGSRVFGYEVDGLDLVIRDGLPYPTGVDGAAAEIEIIAMGLATTAEADHDVWGETLYIGTVDAEWKAQTLYGDTSADSYDRAKRGNGVIVDWRKGLGHIFAAATCEWVMGLTRNDTQVERVTRNVIDRFISENPSQSPHGESE